MYPMSEQPMGIIMYTPDGYMSAQLSKPNRKPFASGDRFKGTDEDYRQAASTYLAYTGEFHVDEEAKNVDSLHVYLSVSKLDRTNAAACSEDRRRQPLSQHGQPPPVRRYNSDVLPSLEAREEEPRLCISRQRRYGFASSRREPAT